MLAASRTVTTQAFQVWLGDEGEVPGVGGEGGIAGGLAKPFDTSCDMTHLVEREDWPAGSALRRVAYLCGTLPEAPEAPEPAAATAAVRANAQGLVTRSCSRTQQAPRWWGRTAARAARSKDQFWRANTSGSERYVLTPAGSTEHRLPSRATRASRTSCSPATGRARRSTPAASRPPCSRAAPPPRR